MPKKATLEEAKLISEAEKTVEVNKSLSLELSPQLEEKKTSDISHDSHHTSGSEKLDLEGGKATQEESGSLQENPETKAGTGFLHEMVKCLADLQIVFLVSTV